MGDSAELYWHKTTVKDRIGRTVTTPCYRIAMDPILLIYSAQYTSTSEDKTTIIKDIIAGNRENVLTQYRMRFNGILGGYPDPKPTDISELSETDRLYVVGHYTEAKTFEELTDMILVDLERELQPVEPIQVNLVSPDYIPGQPYVPRSKRPEWISVGLLGKLYVYHDGTCYAGDKCSCVNGIATKGSSWRVLQRIDDNVIRILYK